MRVFFIPRGNYRDDTTRRGVIRGDRDYLRKREREEGGRIRRIE